MKSKSSVCIAIFTCSLLSAGCGDGADVPDLASVTGTVTLNNAPLPDATVTFVPEEGPVAIGVTNMSGEFTLRTGTHDGAVPGQHQVTVVLSEKLEDEAGDGGDLNNPDDLANFYEQTQAKQEETEQKSLVPEKYTKAASSGLSYEVKSGEDNNFPINLE